MQKEAQQVSFKEVLSASEQSTVSFWPGAHAGPGPGMQGCAAAVPQAGTDGALSCGADPAPGPWDRGAPTHPAPALSNLVFTQHFI